jgi:hypothetical protein
MKRKQTAGDWSYSDLLDAVPHRNEDARSEAMSDGGLFITFRVRVSAFRRAPFKWVAKDRPFRYQRQLDAVGRELWEMMDGRTRMEPIIERFADHHRISFHESRLAIMAFIKSLNSVGAITLQRQPGPR